jgi:hypothetical protein
LKDPDYVQYQDHHVHLEPEARQIGTQAQKYDKVIHHKTNVLIKYYQLVENTKIPKHHRFGSVRWQACSHGCLGYDVRLTDKEIMVIGNG